MFLYCRVVTFYAPALKQNKFYSFIRFGRKNHGNTNVFVELLLPVQFKAALKREPDYGPFCSVIARLTGSVDGPWADRVSKQEQVLVDPRSDVLPFMPVTPPCVSADFIPCTSVGRSAE
jgi:hypothetical protein